LQVRYLTPFLLTRRLPGRLIESRAHGDQRIGLGKVSGASGSGETGKYFVAKVTGTNKQADDTELRTALGSGP
jgi:hypothetical protein